MKRNSLILKQRNPKLIQCILPRPITKRVNHGSLFRRKMLQNLPLLIVNLTTVIFILISLFLTFRALTPDFLPPRQPHAIQARIAMISILIVPLFVVHSRAIVRATM
jgi:hypothetical protein